LAHQGKLWNR